MSPEQYSNTGKEITNRSKTNFRYSFSLLPKVKNDAINAIYAFCRKTDDIVDNENPDKEAKRAELHKWKDDFTRSLLEKVNDELLNDTSVVIKRFNIPLEPFYDLIRGMEMDLDKARYESFDELYEYCYCAAGTVGLMCIEIFGYSNPKTKDFAVAQGVALQLTNILRDVKKDADNGRIYIPKEDMDRFGYSEKDLINSTYNHNFVELMKFEAKRAREYYREADGLLSKEDKGLMFAARIMRHIYFDLLGKIEKRQYNVFKEEVRVSKLKKLFWTFGTYFKYRVLYDFKDPRGIT
ncbi:MAG TPA: phytoene/squalene synthase family protein [Ignavibacteria bacterium]|nr:phytoene/squalene synthase family protein [Ignavibacteria bacterium]